MKKDFLYVVQCTCSFFIFHFLLVLKEAHLFCCFSRICTMEKQKSTYGFLPVFHFYPFSFFHKSLNACRLRLKSQDARDEADLTSGFKSGCFSVLFSRIIRNNLSTENGQMGNVRMQWHSQPSRHLLRIC